MPYWNRHIVALFHTFTYRKFEAWFTFPALFSTCKIDLSLSSSTQSLSWTIRLDLPPKVWRDRQSYILSARVVILQLLPSVVLKDVHKIKTWKDGSRKKRHTLTLTNVLSLCSKTKRIHVNVASVTVVNCTITNVRNQTFLTFNSTMSSSRSISCRLPLSLCITSPEMKTSTHPTMCPAHTNNTACNSHSAPKWTRQRPQHLRPQRTCSSCVCFFTLSARTLNVRTPSSKRLQYCPNNPFVINLDPHASFSPVTSPDSNTPVL